MIKKIKIINQENVSYFVILIKIYHSKSYSNYHANALQRTGYLEHYIEYTFISIHIYTVAYTL